MPKGVYHREIGRPPRFPIRRSIKLGVDTMADLEYLARERGTTVGQLIRWILEEYVGEHDGG